jgi:tetratricopeptide (TPR) repeat protein
VYEALRFSCIPQALLLDPSNAVAVCQYGHYMECQQRDYRAAEDMYEKAHRFAPAAAMPLYARAHLRYAVCSRAPLQAVHDD